VQRILQLRNPYYKNQQVIAEKEAKDAEIKELEDFAKDPFKDPDQELIEKYA
jgi:hypothetical protein